MSEQTAAAEAAKKPKRPIAKSLQMCNDTLAKLYADTNAAKARGEKIGWSTSIFPQEIAESMGLCVVYPENHSAGLSARKNSEQFLQHAEGAMEYNNDICAYAKVNLGYMDILEAPGNNMPLPDFVLVANNICNQVTKWFGNIAKVNNIPMFMLDTVFNYEPEVTESRVKFMRAQLDGLIKNLSAYTGKKFDEAKFEEVMKISLRNCALWIEANEKLANEPSPLSGFDLFNYMACMVCFRGKKETTAILEQLILEIDEHIKNGTSTYSGEQNYRIYWDGIACWPHLSHNLRTMRKYGMNVVATAYVRAWALDYKSGDLDGMAEAYSTTAGNNMPLETQVQRRSDALIKFKCDGMLYHMNRSCKVMDCMQYEVQRRVEEKTGVPFTSFDGDQSDYRNYSEAQFETRLEAFAEMMKVRKEGMRNG